MADCQIIRGDALKVLRGMDKGSVHCCITSPPYWGLRDYGVDGQLGLEATPEEYVEKLVAILDAVKRVLRYDGTLWLNLGDAYAGSWGAQSRPNGSNEGSGLQGGSTLSTRQIRVHPKPQSQAGSLKRTPGLKAKDLIGLPWRVAFALQAEGWFLRSDIIWCKPNGMPESVKDRPTRAHEYLFLLSKSVRYYYDYEAVKVHAKYGDHPRNKPQHVGAPGHKTQGGLAGQTQTPPKQRGHGRRHEGFNDRWDKMSKEEQQANGANLRSWWQVATQPFPEAHFATYPPKLIEPCILAGCPAGGRVLDTFGGSGTTGMVALRHGRNAVLVDLKPEYCEMARRRIMKDAPLLNRVFMRRDDA